ncbi:MAG: hypothetical protein J5I50_00230 [Chitinophagaceae bacterium]|nr:hypothetical protein [Chitinophagaceae bacterium]
MKKVVLFFLLLTTAGAYAQGKFDDEELAKQVRLQRLFTGGSLAMGFSSYSTNLGISPQFGYSLTDWADAGINIGVNYLSRRDYQVGGDKLRQTMIGPGAFVRLFPVKFLFASAQFEYNFIHFKYIPAPGSSYTPDKLNQKAPSMLLGGGYASGREGGGNSYYYFSVSWDIMGDRNSPYIDSHGRSVPVFRAGYNIGLFQGNGRRNRF